ncbi:MAG: glycolate oxidase binding subunit, partial [Acidimicrobiaceae bacterium]|nr:glycolate oxidase binding subunit [Acidimicrobiaceae bacterium]
AGTTVAALSASLLGSGQMVPLDPSFPSRATVGGVLAAGLSGPRRLRYGPVRDTVPEVHFVSSAGRVIKAGGPVVKNVSGFDLCRVLVGSLGTLGFLAEVVLRAQPLPAATRWLAAAVDPFEARRRLFRPSSILWDGATTWILLEGHPADIDAEVAHLGGNATEVDAPPGLPEDRRSVRPSEILDLRGTFMAEVGVGTVHVVDDKSRPQREVDPSTLHLNKSLRLAFDPQGRLNPGRMVP